MNRSTFTARWFAAAIAAAATLLVSSSTRAAVAKRVSGNLVFWDQTRGFDAIAANADLFSEISPFWYRVEADGRVVPYVNAAGTSYEDPTILAYLRDRGILTIPTVANILDGTWNGALVSTIIADPVLSEANIASLVALAVEHGFDGIDLDYENLRADDRAAFSSFVERLGVALHAQGKLLTVNVYAKTYEPGSWDGPRAQDWTALGTAADQVRIMTYEYSWSTSAPGPIAPINWVSDVIAFARTQIPAAKIMQGVPLYGYDWVGQRGSELVWRDAMALAATYGVPVSWDTATSSPWFQYTVKTTQHTVWFENAASVAAKLDVANTYDIGGVTIWRLGGEDPDTWPTVRAQFGGVTPPTDAVPPTVAISSPVDGAALTKKLTITAVASDNVRVAHVDFFVNGALLATDSQAPYSTTWNTRNAVRGVNTIAATAYDSSGNKATAQVEVYRLR